MMLTLNSACPITGMSPSSGILIGSSVIPELKLSASLCISEW